MFFHKNRHVAGLHLSIQEDLMITPEFRTNHCMFCHVDKEKRQQMNNWTDLFCEDCSLLCCLLLQLLHLVLDDLVPLQKEAWKWQMYPAAWCWIITLGTNRPLILKSYGVLNKAAAQKMNHYIFLAKERVLVMPNLLIVHWHNYVKLTHIFH